MIIKFHVEHRTALRNIAEAYAAGEITEEELEDEVEQEMELYEMKTTITKKKGGKHDDFID